MWRVAMLGGGLLFGALGGGALGSAVAQVTPSAPDSGPAPWETVVGSALGTATLLPFVGWRIHKQDEAMAEQIARADAASKACQAEIAKAHEENQKERRERVELMERMLPMMTTSMALLDKVQAAMENVAGRSKVDGEIVAKANDALVRLEMVTRDIERYRRQ